MSDIWSSIDGVWSCIECVALTIICFYMSIWDFRRVYPARYGKKHVELDGMIIGDGKAYTRCGSVKCPIVLFYYNDKCYEIADETYLWHEYKIGDNMTICFNPEVNENIVVIKRGKYNIQTTMWVYTFILGVVCLITLIVCIVMLV